MVGVVQGRERVVGEGVVVEGGRGGVVAHVGMRWRWWWEVVIHASVTGSRYQCHAICM